MDQSLALIELGSNASRLLLAEITMGVGYRVIHQRRVQTRLASGPERRLSARAIRDTLAAVRGFVRSLPHGNGLTALAVATAAVRDAENREELLHPLIHKYGLNVVVLSPTDEAYLGALAVLHNLPLQDGLIADLGGGSLQLTHLREGQVAQAVSLPLGAVRMTERFLRSDPPSAQELASLRSEVRQQLHRVTPDLEQNGSFVGIGGTVRTLANLCLGRRADEVTRHGLRLSHGDIATLRGQLESLPLGARQRFPGLKPERADIIVAGVVVIEELMRVAGLHAMTVSTFGVRDGFVIRRTFPGTWPPQALPATQDESLISATSAVGR
jgi:exopolyphosphatase/guanosine-5'-triphosphate,3'-diphosphate pyrophosphatase